MRIVAVIVFVIGVTLAGAGAFYAFKFFERYEAALAQQKRDELSTTQVIVALSDMKFGHQIELNQVKWASWPTESLPEGAFTNYEEFVGDKKERRTAIQSINAGEPLTSENVTELGEAPRLAFQLDEGKRAFSFNISAQTSVAGFVQAGDRVDLLLTRKVDGQTVTQVFMQDVEIIAIDQQTSASERGAKIGRFATIQVDPVDVQRLTIAQTTGTFSLALRGVNEPIKNPEQLVPMTTNDLFGIVEEKAPVQERNTVRVRKGAEVQDVDVD
ncbi:MAG: Flp pilus assembly protein CpaB [Pseudomonadota bacterium]